MALHFLSPALANECIPESDISNAFVVEKLAEGHEKMREQLEVAKISGVWQT